jgi:hypothetical protein
MLAHYWPVLLAFAVLALVARSNGRQVRAAKAKIRAMQEEYERERQDRLRQRWLAPECEKEAA